MEGVWEGCVCVCVCVCVGGGGGGAEGRRRGCGGGEGVGGGGGGMFEDLWEDPLGIFNLQSSNRQLKIKLLLNKKFPQIPDLNPSDPQVFSPR